MDRSPANPTRVFILVFIDISMRKKIGRKERMLAGRNEKFPPANILSFLPSHYNDVHAFVSSTEHGFFRTLGVMSLGGQERCVYSLLSFLLIPVITVMYA